MIELACCAGAQLKRNATAAPYDDYGSRLDQREVVDRHHIMRRVLDPEYPTSGRSDGHLGASI
jgi:hypothetical protein